MLKITEMLIYHESFSAIIGCLLTTRIVSHRDPHASAPRDTPLAAATHRDGSGWRPVTEAAWEGRVTCFSQTC